MNAVIRRKAPHHMTVEDFVAWAGDGRWQLVDGEPRAMSPASATHGTARDEEAPPCDEALDAG